MKELIKSLCGRSHMIVVICLKIWPLGWRLTVLVLYEEAAPDYMFVTLRARREKPGLMSSSLLDS